jgi:hypothetical protein
MLKIQSGRRQFTDLVRRQALRQHAAQLPLIGTTCVARPFRGTLFRNRRREAARLVRQRSDRPFIPG